MSTERLARGALWLLPLYAALLVAGTLTHQPDFTVDFRAYAEYVTTDGFLAGHLAASIGGSALGSVGVVAALSFLLRGPGSRPAALGGALLLAGTVITASVFGAAAFAQPALGSAFLAGGEDIPALNDAVYGAPLLITAATGMLALMVGSVLFGRAVARTAPDLRCAGRAFTIAYPLFVLTGPPGLVAQPLFAAVVAWAAWVIARRLPRATRAPRA